MVKKQAASQDEKTEEVKAEERKIEERKTEERKTEERKTEERKTEEVKPIAKKVAVKTAKKKGMRTPAIVIVVVAVVTVIAMALWGRVSGPASGKNEISLKKAQFSEIVERVSALGDSVEEKHKAIHELNEALAEFVDGSFIELYEELEELEEDIAVLATEKA